jgi:hypothetical protein
VTDTTGIAGVDHLVVWCLAVGAIGGALAILWRLTRSVRQLLHRLAEVADDWQGTPARPGVPERLGVMARLDRIERAIIPESSP